MVSRDIEDRDQRADFRWFKKCREFINPALASVGRCRETEPDS